MALFFCINANLNQQRMDALLNGTTMGTVDSALTTSTNTQYHYVMTFRTAWERTGRAGGQVTWYRNGTLIATRNVAMRLAEIEEVNNWLGRSQLTADCNANATYNEFRIYNHALTQAEITASLTAGADSLASPPPTPDHLWTFNNQASSTSARHDLHRQHRRRWSPRCAEQRRSLTGGAVMLPGTTTGNQTAADDFRLPRSA